MAAALVARGPVRSRSTEILCAGSLSIVVDSVDGEVTGDAADDQAFGEDGGVAGGGGGGDADARSDVSNASSRGSRTSISKEEADAKLALFKTEAAARLTELERLLDEHDQIVRELKRSESDSGCINYAELQQSYHSGNATERSKILPSWVQDTSPSLAQHISPTLGQHTSSSLGQQTSPSMGQHTSPSKGQHTSPTLDQGTSTSVGQHTSPSLS